MVSNIEGVNLLPTSRYIPLARPPCWEPPAPHGAILWSLRAGARRQAGGTQRRQPLEREPGDETVVRVMEGNKSISKCCRAACFLVQQASGQQLQHIPCDASLYCVCARVQSRSSAESFHPSVKILGCLREPQLPPSLSESMFPVETTSAAQDCFSHYNTPVTEQVKYHGDQYVLFLFRVSLRLSPSKCTWLKI